MLNLKFLASFAQIFFLLGTVNIAVGAEMKVGQPAPIFHLKNQDGVEFQLISRKGKWTVLYFYPKAGTPGCTKQACAFRDNIKRIRDLNADVFGISADSVSEQAAFHKEHRLNFSILADPEMNVISLYGVGLPQHKFAQRWTFIIDPELNVREIAKNVDPIMDAERIARKLQELKKHP